MIGSLIKLGLQRKASTLCSVWAENYRFMETPSGPWSFKFHPWTREIHDYTTVGAVVMKGAQLAITESALNKVFHKMDIEKRDCLYLLPAMKPDASDFSLARFDPAIDLSPHLQNLFSKIKNIGHKRAGTVNLYIRGAKSKKGLKSIPVGFTVFDEVDEMEQKNIPLAMERMSGQMAEFQWMMLSTPTIPDYGIHKKFLEGTQEEFFFPCPHCNRQISFTYPDSIVVTADDHRDPRVMDSYLICTECKATINNDTKHIALGKGKWVAQFPDRLIRSFHISQLYSSAKGATPAVIAKAILKSKESIADEVELYNSKLGKTFVPKGGQITDENFVQCYNSYTQHDAIKVTNRLRTAGIDVGKVLHIEIDEWIIEKGDDDVHERSVCKLVAAFTVDTFEEVGRRLKEFCVRHCVVDAMPERREAQKFCTRYSGAADRCYYIETKGRSINLRDDNVITANRTEWMDIALGRFHKCRILLPRDLPEEYKSQLKVPVRTITRDKTGNPEARYYCEGADHYAHARTYSELALARAVSGGVNSTIYTKNR